MAYAAAMDKCTAPEYNDALAVLSELLLRVHAELRMHGSYVAKWGVDMRAGFKPSAATRAYTDYLMEVAHDPEVSSSAGSQDCNVIGVCGAASRSVVGMTAVLS